MAAVKRIAIMFPDGSISVMSNSHGETAARVQAKRETDIFNKGVGDERKKAQFGSIDVDLMSFRELH